MIAPLNPDFRSYQRVWICVYLELTRRKGTLTWYHPVLWSTKTTKMTESGYSLFSGIHNQGPSTDTSCFDPVHYLCSKKAMAPHSSTLAWKIPWMEEPGRLRSMRLLRVGHNWETSLSLFTFTHERRKCQPTPVFLPGESQGWGSLVGCCLWGHTESDTTEAT